MITLKFKFSDLYAKTQYRSKRDLIVDRITEYDIKSANTTMLGRAGKVLKRDLELLNSLPKREREVIVGKMIREDRTVQKVISDGIRSAKRELFRENGIRDDDIQSIRNDAVFIIGRRLKTVKFGSVEFRVKNVYTAYALLDGGIEAYYSPDRDEVDIKGISDVILENPDHKDGMLRFLAACMGYVARNNERKLREHIIEFVDDYKNRRLPVRYYREINKDNGYRIGDEIGAFGFFVDKVSEDAVKDLNIAYNYNRIVLPVVWKFI